MARKKKTRVDASGGGFGGSFGDLLKAQGLAPETVSEDSPAAVVASPAETLVGARPVVRISRKGRRGKTVTLVQQLPEALLDDVAKRLRKALGCGASVEEDEVVVQGDQRDRVGAWLTDQGARPNVDSLEPLARRLHR